VLARVLRWFGYCRHRSTYRERRPLDGTGPRVLHFVCNDCGRATPAMIRSREEHAAVLERGRPASILRIR